ncbi:MAG: HlyD family type I secretion periplasmic adaptor subunit [Desulfatiglandaceae bacterium]
MPDNETKEVTPVEVESPGKPAATGSSKKVIIWGLILVFLFFGVLGTWAATAKLQGAVIAPGEIIVETYRKQVQHLSGGIVKEILVREGGWVDQGQVLIRLDGENVLASRDMLLARMDSLLARLARLMAEIKLAKSIKWPDYLMERAELPDAAEYMHSEKQIFDANLASKNSQKTLHRAQINRLNTMIQGRQKQIAAVRKTILSLEEELKAKQSLLREKYIDQPQVMEIQRTLNSNEARLEELETEIAESRQNIRSLELQIQDLDKKYAQEAAKQMGEVRQEIVALREQLRPAEDAARRLDITAPASGVVVNMEVRTEGGVIQGGAPLMEIVPRDSGLVVAAQVPPDKIDEVRQGQSASVSLSAFPMRYTPKVDGKVVYVSADRIEPERMGALPHYLVYVRLDLESLRNAIGDETRLTPGMPAEAYIQTEARTMLSYILTPITESMGRAFRE